MRKVLLSLVALSTVAVAMPAQAAHYGHRGSHIERQLSDIANRIERAEYRGALSRREANGLLRRADHIDRLHDRYARNGLNRREMAILQRQVRDLRQDLRFERRDRNGRWG